MSKFFWIAMLALLCSSATAQELTLRFSSLPSRMVPSQMARQVMTEACKRLQIGITFIEVPNNRKRHALANRELDGVDYRTIDVPYGDLIKIDVPITENELVVYSIKSLPQFSNYESLRKYKIGYFASAEIYAVRLKGMQVETAPTVESLFLKLQAGRTDLVMESRYATCALQKLGIRDIKIQTPALEVVQGYPWISQRYGYLKPALENELKTMQTDGTIKRIQQRVLREFYQRCG